jgi:predicted ATPase
MIREVEIGNFKSIADLKIELGRVSVLIGANGSGKSNILEAMALGSAAANDKLDNEFLVSRGIRVPADPRFMRSAFDAADAARPVTITFRGPDAPDWSYALERDNTNPYSSWWTDRREFDRRAKAAYQSADAPGNAAITELLAKVGADVFVQAVQRIGWDPSTVAAVAQDLGSEPADNREFLRTIGEVATAAAKLRRFLVYSPENSVLRALEREGQIQPLGIRGEGLFRLLGVLATQDAEGLHDIRRTLSLFDWFADFEVPESPPSMERAIHVRDRHLDPELALLDQNSANEGFLFLLFYCALFISKDTPEFFAIDNVDASLNPKLCARLMSEIVELSEKHGKQVIITTHNPAVLDGLDLNDDEQRLFVVSRGRDGHTRGRRVPAPKYEPGQATTRLSEAFLRGYLGGLPDNF